MVILLVPVYNSFDEVLEIWAPLLEIGPRSAWILARIFLLIDSNFSNQRLLIRRLLSLRLRSSVHGLRILASLVNENGVARRYQHCHDELFILGFIPMVVCAKGNVLLAEICRFALITRIVSR